MYVQGNAAHHGGGGTAAGVGIRWSVRIHSQETRDLSAGALFLFI